MMKFMQSTNALPEPYPRRDGWATKCGRSPCFPLFLFCFFPYNIFMLTVIFGIACIAFTVFACLPGGLDWGEEIIFFLKGAAPVLAAFVGLIAILIGIADIRDRQEAKREEMEALKADQNEKIGNS